MAYLDLINLRKTFGSMAAVSDFSLSVSKGEFVSFLGPSGCGKTTTMRMVAGFETPDHGSIQLDGEELTRIPANRRRVGMVFQSYALFPHLTVRENIVFGMSLARANKSDKTARANQLLDLIQLPNLGERYPHQLSGGQQQRVALARALAIQPRVLLLDEPLSALDAKIRDELRTEIRRIQRELNITAIYVTHDQDEALALSDRIVVMNAGKIEQIGTPFEVYNRPASAFVARFVGAQSAISGTLEPSFDRVKTGAGCIQLATPLSNNKAGDTIQIMLRPEMARLGAGLPGQNSLNGKVDTITFLGSVVRIAVKTEGGTVAIDQLNHPNLALPATGTHVDVSFAPEACHILE